MDLTKLPVTKEDLTPNTYNPDFIIALNVRLNAQADRLQTLFDEIAAGPSATIEYADIMHWRSRADYLRNVGQAKRAAELEKREALKEAKNADEDEEFMEGYKTFLDTEFNAS